MGTIPVVVFMVLAIDRIADSTGDDRSRPVGRNIYRRHWLH